MKSKTDFCINRLNEVGEILHLNLQRYVFRCEGSWNGDGDVVEDVFGVMEV